ncbi:MAG TPA: AAA family ATPase, partial [Chloroflexota bacterium]|nr:AAA family ATPase [Chloroflexota bacterium]
MERTGAERVGALLKSYRRAAGLTQQALAERAGYSVVYVSMLERGERRAQAATIDALSAALGLTAFDRSTLAGAAEDTAEGGLVGRGAELELLRRHLGGEGPPVLLFAGEPGIGKTHLLREAARLAPVLGWKALEGGCARRGEEPYAPLYGAVRSYARKQASERLREELRDCAWLTRLLPDLEAVVGCPEPFTEEQERRLMLDALGRFLRQAGGPAGTLLVLDDLHWAGADALDAVTELLTAQDGIRVVAAYRDVDVADHGPLAMWLGDLAASGMATHRTLGRLTPRESDELLGSLLGTEAEIDPHVRERALAGAGGLPFYVSSFAQEVRSATAVGRAPEVIPWDVKQGILTRVATLPQPARDVLDVATVAGRSTSGELLKDVTGQATDIVVDALGHLCRTRILVEDGERGYRFSHDVIREVLEANVGVARRRELHRRVATALEGRGTVEELAYHYAHSDADESAVIYLERAGDQARKRCAHAAASGYYRELVDRFDALGRRADAAAAREKLGDTLARSGRFDEALANLEAAAALWDVLGERDREWLVVARLGRVHERRGTPGEGIERLERLRVLPGRRAPRAEAEMDAALAPLLLLTGRYHEQLEATERAASVAREIGDERLLAEAEVWRGCALNQLGRLEEGRAAQEGAISLAEATGDLTSLLHAVNDLGFLSEIRGEFAISRRFKARALELAERGGDPLSVATMSFRCGQNAFLCGDWTAAETLFVRGMGLSRQLGASSIAAYPPFGLALLAFARDEIDEARTFAGETLRIAKGVDRQAEEAALALLA